MVQLDQEIIKVAVARDVEVFGGQAKVALELVDAGEIVQNHGIVKRVFPPPLAFIIGKEECPVLNDWSTQSEAILVLLQLVEPGSGQRAVGVEHVVAEIFVHAAMQVVRSALGYDIHDSAYGPARFHAVGIVDHAEFTHRLFRRRGLLHAGSGGDVVRAVNGNEVEMNVLSGEGKLGHRLNDHVRAAGG